MKDTPLSYAHGTSTTPLVKEGDHLISRIEDLVGIQDVVVPGSTFSCDT